MGLDCPSTSTSVLLGRELTKMNRYGSETDGEDESSSVYKVNPDIVAGLYRDFLIPLNKDVQVAYLLERLEPEA